MYNYPVKATKKLNMNYLIATIIGIIIGLISLSIILNFKTCLY